LYDKCAINAQFISTLLHFVGNNVGLREQNEVNDCKQHAFNCRAQRLPKTGLSDDTKQTMY